MRVNEIKMIPDRPHEFIETFLTEFPQEPFFSEASLSLRDWMRAFALVKNEGDIPNPKSPYVKNFQNCLLVAFCERTNEYLKAIN